MFEAIAEWKKRGAQKIKGNRNEKASHAYGLLASTFVEDKASFSNDVDLMEALESVGGHRANAARICNLLLELRVGLDDLLLRVHLRGAAASWIAVRRSAPGERAYLLSPRSCVANALRRMQSAGLGECRGLRRKRSRQGG